MKASVDGKTFAEPSVVGRYGCQTQDGSYFFHGGSTSHGAEQTV